MYIFVLVLKCDESFELLTIHFFPPHFMTILHFYDSHDDYKYAFVSLMYQKKNLFKIVSQFRFLLKNLILIYVLIINCTLYHLYIIKHSVMLSLPLLIHTRSAHRRKTPIGMKRILTMFSCHSIKSFLEGGGGSLAVVFKV